MISVDTLADNTAFAKKESADFPILADPTHATARKYGVLADYSRFKLGELANRWTFYIGADGKILDIDKKVNPANSGQSVTFTATVFASAPGAGTATGNVTFSDGATVLGTVAVNASGIAAFSTSSQPLCSPGRSALPLPRRRPPLRARP